MGYYYVNLTKALIALYRGETPDATVMALWPPFQTGTVTGARLPLHWSMIGRTPSEYAISVDGQPIATNVRGSQYDLDLSKLSAGKHRIILLARGTRAYYDLDPSKITTKSAQALPVTFSIEFTYAGK